MSDLPVYWCICKKYCKGSCKQLKAYSTWWRHYRDADEDEKQSIWLQKRSDTFRAFIQSFAPSVTDDSAQDLVSPFYILCLTHFNRNL